ncbi:LNP1 (YHR192W) [Zygosaccharomyces parabailii]|nr:LNP1 (YHR192W) [Zygosaccharomyces parabailii]CDH11373.1 uncharacterized protein ZBAI_03159 [Zygosaccharomyces bailii ISA1307]
MWFRSSKKKTLVERYTEELTSITSQIHRLDQKLKSSQQASDKLQWQLGFYGAIIALSVSVYVHFYYASVWLYPLASAGATFVFVVLTKGVASRVDQWTRERQARQLDSLRALHQQTLNKLKEETNFHATNSVIQRFSQGEEQSDDAMLLMDEEIGKKYQELKDLQEELNQFRRAGNSKDKQERDKWFDKVLNVLSGGDIPRPIICQKCKKQSGAYRVGTGPLIYICPLCGWREPPNGASARPEECQEKGK